MRIRRTNSLFGYFFGVVVAGILVSHLLTTWLFFQFEPRPAHSHQAPPPPPDTPNADRPAHPRPKPPPETTERQLLPQNLGWVLAIQCLVLGIAAWFAARNLTRPIQNLAQAAHQLAINLHSPPIAESGPQEIRQTARVFNHMQQRLQQQIEQQAHFLAAISHDLRTPLTRLQLRLEHIPDPGLQQSMRNDLHAMTAMLNATLDYLRGATESDTDPWQELDIEALIQAITDNAQELGQNVGYQGQAAPLRVQPMALKRCLLNLIDNALHYGGEAQIQLFDSPQQLVITIQNKGPGIPDSQLQQVFEPFVRLETSRNRHTGGVGLGLSIARQIALRHGGNLSLSNAQNGGLIAHLSLPRTKAG